MMRLNVGGTEYKVKFGYNCFCDTDLMDRVEVLTRLFNRENVDNDEDVSGVGKIKELFCVVRDLIFVGFRKYNPVGTVQEIGDLLDDYIDEETEEERGLFKLFSDLSEELMNQGFLSDLMKGTPEDMKDGAKTPTDHKKPQKKTE